MLKPGLYRHYKGNLYRLLFLARHTESMENMVIYQDAKDSDKIWARPAYMWEEAVKTDGKMVRRFEYVGEEADER